MDTHFAAIFRRQISTEMRRRQHEALTRLFSGRATWFWLFTEPLFRAIFLAFVFSAVRVRNIGGVDVVLWVMVGLLAFFTFRRTAQQSTNGIGANRALFAYRQIKPVDTVLVP